MTDSYLNVLYAQLLSSHLSIDENEKKAMFFVFHF